MGTGLTRAPGSVRYRVLLAVDWRPWARFKTPKAPAPVVLPPPPPPPPPVLAPSAPVRPPRPPAVRTAPRPNFKEGTFLPWRVPFALQKAQLDAKGRAALREVVAYMAAHPEIKTVYVVGYTDTTGPEGLNLDLSLARARAVRRYLVAHGLDAERIVLEGRGPQDSSAPNATRPGRMANRRVMFFVPERDLSF